MSEERRKKQQARLEQDLPPNRALQLKILVAVVILVILGSGFLISHRRQSHRLDEFAQCLSAKQAKMYGLFWCPHCIEQKEMFGDAFHYVPYAECAIKGSSEITTECKIAGVKMFPSWQFGMDTPKEGVLSLEALSDKTGCSLP